MKKFLCVFLSLVLAFSVVTVAFAADDEGSNLAQTLADKIADDNFINAFNGKTLEFNSAELNRDPYYVGGKYDVTKIINDGKINQVEFLGLNLGQVYSSQTEVLDWAQLSVSYSDVANLWGALNQYISYYLKYDYTDEHQLCTAKNATGIANVISHMLKAGRPNVTLTFPTSFVNRKTFYTTISDASGLTEAIIKGWLTTTTVNGKTVYEPKYGVNYRPLVISTLGVPLYNQDGSGGSMELFDYFDTPKQEYKVPSELGGYIIKTVIETAATEGPIAYLLSILKRFAVGYQIDLYNSVSALLYDKIEKGKVTKEALYSFDVLLNTLFNDNTSSDSTRLQCVPFPTARFAKADKTTEQFLYLMIYTNLLGKHQNNKAPVEKLKTIVNSNSSINGEEKTITNSLIDGMFFGNLTELAKIVNHVEEENLSRIGTTWGWNFTEFFARFWSFISSFFDGIFRTLKNGINLSIFD